MCGFFGLITCEEFRAVFFGRLESGSVWNVCSTKIGAVSWTFFNHCYGVSTSGSSFSSHQQAPTQSPLPSPSPCQSHLYHFPWRMLASPRHPNLPPLPISIYCPLALPCVQLFIVLLFQLTLCVSCCCAVFSLHSPLAQLEAQAQICASHPAPRLFCPGIPRRTGFITPRREDVPASTKVKGPQVAIFSPLVCCPWSVAGSAGFHSFAAVALQMPSTLQPHQLRCGPLPKLVLAPPGVACGFCYICRFPGPVMCQHQSIFSFKRSLLFGSRKCPF